MLKKALFFTIATAFPLVMAFVFTRITFHIFTSEQDLKDSGIVMMLATLFSPAIVANIVPFFAGKSPFWNTELVNWSGCFSMLYMGFTLLITRMFGIYSIVMGIPIVIMASIVVARRFEEKRWRSCVVGAYKEN